ncbi:hypothetical protein ACFWNN_38655 [Lentzea sp. NPDC058450]|uniref:hypothetical protein n=1 Tax=Lentzea sp. NPDC058450 TaxID=3346505 RepID=UPI00365F08E3
MNEDLRTAHDLPASTAASDPKRARVSGVDARLAVTEGTPHIWQHFGAFVPEARESLARIATHFRSHIPA